MQSTHQLSQYVAHRSGHGYPALDTLGDMLGREFSALGAGISIGPVARHGTQASHAPVTLVPTSFEQLHIAGGFIGTGQQ